MFADLNIPLGMLVNGFFSVLDSLFVDLLRALCLLLIRGVFFWGLPDDVLTVASWCIFLIVIEFAHMSHMIFGPILSGSFGLSTLLMVMFMLLVNLGSALDSLVSLWSTLLPFCLVGKSWFISVPPGISMPV